MIIRIGMILANNGRETMLEINIFLNEEVRTRGRARMRVRGGAGTSFCCPGAAAVSAGIRPMESKPLFGQYFSTSRRIF
jgi:hypothetical protein